MVLRKEMEALKKETLTLRKEMDTLRKTMPDNKLLWAAKVKRPWKIKVEKPNFRTEKLAETLRDSFEATQGVKDDDPQKKQRGPAASQGGSAGGGYIEGGYTEERRSVDGPDASAS